MSSTIVTLPKIADTEINDFSAIVHDGNYRRGFARLPSTDEEFRNQAMTVALALILTELDEAFDDTDDQNEMHRNHYSDSGKPEGFPSEVADVAIRILDLAGRWKLDLATSFASADFSPLAAEGRSLNSRAIIVRARIIQLMRDFTKIVEAVRVGDDAFVLTGLGQALADTYRIADTMGFNLNEVIDEKLAYNETRAHKHGKKF